GSPALFLSHATAPTQIYTLSLHDALPISIGNSRKSIGSQGDAVRAGVEVFTCNNNGYSGERTHNDGVQKRLPCSNQAFFSRTTRSEEHTSELQSRFDLVCRLLLEKKKQQ